MINHHLGDERYVSFNPATTQLILHHAGNVIYMDPGQYLELTNFVDWLSECADAIQEMRVDL